MMRPPSTSAKRPSTAAQRASAAGVRPGSAVKRATPTASSTTNTSRPGSARGPQVAQKEKSATTSTTKTATSKLSNLPPKTAVKAKKPSTASTQVEESKIGAGLPNSNATDNPWGLDHSQYYIELGGVSKFLQYRNSLKKQSVQPDAEDVDPFSRSIRDNDSVNLIRNIERVLELLDSVSHKSMQYQRAHAVKNYSDLLLAESTNYRSQKANELATFLAQINRNKENLLRKVRQASRMSENCLVLSKTYHEDLCGLLQSMALDLQSEIQKAPMGIEKSKEDYEKLGELGQAGMRQAANYKRLKEQLDSLKATVAKLQQ